MSKIIIKNKNHGSQGGQCEDNYLLVCYVHSLVETDKTFQLCLYHSSDNRSSKHLRNIGQCLTD